MPKYKTKSPWIGMKKPTQGDRTGPQEMPAAWYRERIGPSAHRPTERERQMNPQEYYRHRMKKENFMEANRALGKFISETFFKEK